MESTANVPQISTHPTGRLPHTVAAAPADIIHDLIERAYADPAITPGTFPLTPVYEIVLTAIAAAAPLRSAAGKWDDVDKGHSDVAFGVAVEAMAEALRTSSNPASTARGLAVAFDMVTAEAGQGLAQPASTNPLAARKAVSQ